ncbi:MAG: toll/interleukin-1 receptor domain-containing protein [Nitrososphaerota archaeon]|nr:toll/interleukin-1 receptor domain-containing protein [Nitrososphaerota archaeon]
MKVFISWSGDHSRQIAEVLKKWIKQVIQSVEPFVSSEDIQKGERWSTNIAKELQDTEFGILCVTKDNYKAPWLLFEAGALSKTMDNSLLVPFLFDLKHSDLSNSPLLQFQAVPFSKGEIRKLINVINEKSEKKLDDLAEIFEKWYPDLENALKKITPNTSQETEDDESSINSSRVLEEILSLSRENQKLLRNSEGRSSDEFEQISKKLDSISEQNDRNSEYSRRRRKFHPMMFEEIIHFSKEKDLDLNYKLLVILSFFREDYPWVYTLGKELIDTLKSNKSPKQKKEAIQSFRGTLEHTNRLLMMNEEMLGARGDMLLFRELPMVLMKLIDRISLTDSSQSR